MYFLPCSQTSSPQHKSCSCASSCRHWQPGGVLQGRRVQCSSPQAQIHTEQETLIDSPSVIRRPSLDRHSSGINKKILDNYQ